MEDYRCCVHLVLWYCSESWNLTATEEFRLSGAKQWIVRMMCTSKYLITEFSKVDFHNRVHAVAKVQYLITKNSMHWRDTSMLPEWCTNKETENPGGGLWIAQWKTKEIINTILEGWSEKIKIGRQWYCGSWSLNCLPWSVRIHGIKPNNWICLIHVLWLWLLSYNG